MREPTQEEWETLAGKYSLRLVVVHGSHAKGFAHDRSDVDVAFASENRLDTYGDLHLHKELATLIGLQFDDLDLQTVDGASLIFRQQVAEYGRLLYECVPGTWEGWRAEIRQRWAEDAPRRKARDAELTAWAREILHAG